MTTTKTTKYFFDSEFMEDGRTIDLLSIGIVCEDGREFYAEDSMADVHKANPWVEENVLPHLWHRQGNKTEFNHWSQQPGHFGGLMDRRAMATAITAFVGQFAGGEHPPQFWAYYGDYDWIVLCQLFGTMMDLPQGWPMFAMDVKQLCVMLGNPKLPEQSSTEHNALYDARWTKQAYDWLIWQEDQSLLEFEL